MEKREKVSLDYNVPVQVTLKYSTGKMIDNRWGKSVLYVTEDGRSLFVDLETSMRISQLQLEAGESFLICKQKRDGRNRFSVWLSPGTEIMRASKEQPEPPSEVEEQMRATIANLAEGKPAATPRPIPVASALTAESQPPQRGTGTNGPVAMQRSGSSVPIKATYSAAMQEFLLMAGRATRETEVKLDAEGGSVRFDSRDVAALATTCFIQAAKEGWIIWRPGEAQ